LLMDGLGENSFRRSERNMEPHSPFR
jgi:hypothetical protein